MEETNIKIGTPETRPSRAVFESKIRESGNSKVITIPKTVREALELVKNQKVKVTIEDLDMEVEN
jgi:bifunctional DNA-binding transcriptional regulator/antitoxin component of YhaV-PrlF toxin-antitoxin module